MVGICQVPVCFVEANNIFKCANAHLRLQAGAMVSYIFDVARQKEATLASVWVTMVVSNIASML